MSGFLFYAGVIGFCLGVGGATLFGASVATATWLLLLAVVLALLWRQSRSGAFALVLLSVCLAGSAAGLLRVVWADTQLAQSDVAPLVEQDVTLEGVIVREPDVRERTQHLYIETNNETILVFTDRFTSYRYGDVVTVSGTLTQPTSFTTDLGRTFNYPGYLQAQGVQHLVHFGTVTVTGQGAGNVVVTALLDFKQRFMATLERLLREPQVGLSEGLLLGVKQALGDELEQVFRSTGIIHIVVLSGYNVALVVAFVMCVLAYVLPYQWRLGVGVLAIAGFALMVGLSATVVRASLMAVFILLAKSLGRTYAVIRGLMVAGLIMLLLNPYLLVYDVGFQLSFLATLGLILLAPQLERWFLWMPTVIGLREFLLATLATQIFVLPILLYQIGEFSVVSVLVNVLVLPMVPIAMLSTFVTGLVGGVAPTLALPLVYLTDWSLSYILIVATWFAALPFAAYVVPAFPFVLVPVAYVLLGYWYWRLTRQPVALASVVKGWTIVTEAQLLNQLADKRASDEPPIYFRS